MFVGRIVSVKAGEIARLDKIEKLHAYEVGIARVQSYSVPMAPNREQRDRHGHHQY
jgi:hypothetical protein